MGLIHVTADGIVTGDYWDNLSEFELRASASYGQRRDLKQRVEFEDNAYRMRLENREKGDKHVKAKRTRGTSAAR